MHHFRVYGRMEVIVIEEKDFGKIKFDENGSDQELNFRMRRVWNALMRSKELLSCTHLLCLKWITNKDLLYSTGNAAQCYITNYLRKEFEKE